MSRTEKRRLAKDKAGPILSQIDQICSQFPTNNEKRGFLAKLHRAIYERRKALYRYGLHPNQKS